MDISGGLTQDIQQGFGALDMQVNYLELRRVQKKSYLNSVIAMIKAQDMI